MSHCPWCRPCCCRVCDPWTHFCHVWMNLHLAIKYPGFYGRF